MWSPNRHENVLHASSKYPLVTKHSNGQFTIIFHWNTIYRWFDDTASNYVWLISSSISLVISRSVHQWNPLVSPRKNAWDFWIFIRHKKQMVFHRFWSPYHWLVVKQPTTLKNDGVRQLGWWLFPVYIYMESHKNPWFQTSNQPINVATLWVLFLHNGSQDVGSWDSASPCWLRTKSGFLRMWWPLWMKHGWFFASIMIK